ncbi:MAG: HI0074 family nucleotidyltransferase substrate-binding subunit [Candidatus Moraniibacteriota bacterium]
MDYLKEKFSDLEQALIAWKKALDAPFSDLNRDATIQRYEFSLELLWKTVKMYLKEYEGIECNSPKACFREIRVILDLSEENIEQCMAMTDDRNLSVHTYSEKMANELYARLVQYWQIADLIAGKIKEKANL